MIKWGFRLFVIGILPIISSSCSAHAQDGGSGLEALIDPALQVDSGTALARRQIAEQDLLSAAATLERVLIFHENADAGRLLYASLLCRLDDPAGADVELGLLDGHPVPDDGWSELTSICGMRRRPSSQVGSPNTGSPQ